MIRLQGVHFSYNKEHVVIKDINHTFVPGQPYIIRGENGAGKTTLVKLILGLLKPTSGKVENSENITYSYLPDHNGIYEFLTVSQNIQFRLGIYNIPFHKTKEQMNCLLQYFRISQSRDVLVSNLSWGTKKGGYYLCVDRQCRCFDS